MNTDTAFVFEESNTVMQIVKTLASLLIEKDLFGDIYI